MTEPHAPPRRRRCDGPLPAECVPENGFSRCQDLRNGVVLPRSEMLGLGSDDAFRNKQHGGIGLCTLQGLARTILMALRLVVAIFPAPFGLVLRN